MLLSRLLILRNVNKFRINFYSYSTTQVESLTQDASKSTSTDVETKNQKLTFAKLFRESKFVSLGQLSNKVLVGKIVQIIDEDIYIDFGGKFHCVCKKSSKDNSKYAKNDFVKILLKDFEMASHFLGATKHVTLLESDAKLLGLYQKQNKNEPTEENVKKDEEIKVKETSPASDK